MVSPLTQDPHTCHYNQDHLVLVMAFTIQQEQRQGWAPFVGPWASFITTAQARGMTPDELFSYS